MIAWLRDSVAGAATLFGVEALEHPAWLLPLLALAALAVGLGLRRRPPALPWPGVAEAAAAGAAARDPVRLAAGALRAGTLAALALAIAGPAAVQRAASDSGAGLDLVLVLDTSGSMRALDAEVGGAWKTRLDLARTVVERFALRRVYAGDRVGLVVFGDAAFTQCPLTGDGGLLAAALSRVSAGMAGEATALGDALALGVKRAIAARDDAPATAGAPADRASETRPGEGRVVVLLTDGRSNAGAVPVDVAAGLARAEHVRVHAVGIGGEGAVAMAGDGASAGLRFERHDLDLETLSQIANATGGRVFRARSSADLARVYDEIDALERVPHREPPLERRTPRPERALGVAAALLAAELALARIVRRRIP